MQALSRQDMPGTTVFPSIGDGVEELSGYLKKYGADIISIPRKRWFVLMGPSLQYYTKSDKKVKKGQINLGTVSSVDIINDSKSECMFQLTTRKRVYKILARNKEELMMWTGPLAKRAWEVKSDPERFGLEPRSSLARSSVAQSRCTSPSYPTSSRATSNSMSALDGNRRGAEMYSARIRGESSPILRNNTRVLADFKLVSDWWLSPTDEDTASIATSCSETLNSNSSPIANNSSSGREDSEDPSVGSCIEGLGAWGYDGAAEVVVPVERDNRKLLLSKLGLSEGKAREDFVKYSLLLRVNMLVNLVYSQVRYEAMTGVLASRVVDSTRSEVLKNIDREYKLVLGLAREIVDMCTARAVTDSINNGRRADGIVADVCQEQGKVKLSSKKKGKSSSKKSNADAVVLESLSTADGDIAVTRKKKRKMKKTEAARRSSSVSTLFPGIDSFDDLTSSATRPYLETLRAPLLRDLSGQVELVQSWLNEEDEDQTGPHMKGYEGSSDIIVTERTPHAKSLVLMMMAILLHGLKDNISESRNHTMEGGCYSRSRTLFDFLKKVDGAKMKEGLEFVESISLPPFVPKCEEAKVRSVILLLTGMNNSRLIEWIEEIISADPLVLLEWYSAEAILCNSSDCRVFLRKVVDLLKVQFDVKVTVTACMTTYLSARLMSLGLNVVVKPSYSSELNDFVRSEEERSNQSWFKIPRLKSIRNLKQEESMNVDFLRQHEVMIHLQRVADNIRNFFLTDSSIPANTDVAEAWRLVDFPGSRLSLLIRQNLCDVLAEILAYGFTAKRSMLSILGPDHVYDYLEALLPSSLIHGAIMRSSLQAVGGLKSPLEITKSAKFRALVCHLLNKQSLHLLFEVMESSETEGKKFYGEWSFARCAQALQCISSTLEGLSKLEFQLDWKQEVEHEKSLYLAKQGPPKSGLLPLRS